MFIFKTQISKHEIPHNFLPICDPALMKVHIYD